jgi:SAM-dependent methyltransferase
VKRTARAALKNREPLAAALDELLPERGTVLELGSGTGEHVVFLARRFPALTWQPSDPDPAARASIAAWAAEVPRPNLLPPLDYDLRLPLWQRRPVDALLCVNVLHVTPWACAEALFAGAGGVLAGGGPLAVYGPCAARDAPLGGRLARLDRELRAADPALGVRVVESLDEAAARGGLRREAAIAMPEEGDLLLVYRRPAGAGAP